MAVAQKPASNEGSAHFETTIRPLLMTFAIGGSTI